MDIVTGHVGSAHVTSWQDRDLNIGIFGNYRYILEVGNNMAASIITNNEIHIADGVLIVQGCQGVIQKGTYDTITIDNGSSGMKRHDLICAQYQKSGGVESLGWTVIKGTPAASNPTDPSYTSGDIQSGDTPVQFPIYRVVLDGLTITEVQEMAAYEANLNTLNRRATNIVVTESFTDTVDFAGNEFKTVNFSCAKLNYVPIGVVGYATGSHNIYIYGINVNDNTISVSYKNASSSTYADRNLRIDVLFVKDIQ